MVLQFKNVCDIIVEQNARKDIITGVHWFDIAGVPYEIKLCGG